MPYIVFPVQSNRVADHGELGLLGLLVASVVAEAVCALSNNSVSMSPVVSSVQQNRHASFVCELNPL